MTWMLLPYRRYADFQGRSRRKEYWMFILFQALVTVAVLLLAGFADVGAAATGAPLWSSVGGLLLLLFWAISFIPSISVQVRRFHDQDRSGWWVLLNIVPLGGLIVLVFMLLEGTKGPNRFGPDPKAPGMGEVFA